MRGKKTFTDKTQLPFEDEVVQFETHGYTWKRKIAIGLWMTVLIPLSFITIRCFSLFNEHIDYLLRIDLTLMPNFAFAMDRWTYFVPIVDWARYPLSLITFLVAVKMLIALFWPPVVKTESVRISMMRENYEDV